MKRALLLFVLAWLPVNLFSQPVPAPRLTFEVATIRPSDPNSPGFAIKPLPGGNGYTIHAATVKSIISLMLKIPNRQITGGPDWLSSEPYDIEARADHEYTIDDLHSMMMNLLADRFQLRFHNESKDGNVYALVVDKAGSKMKPNTSPSDFNVVLNGTGIGAATAVRMSMQYLCWFLGQILQNDERPVIDLTGLKGNYDFKLVWLPDIPPNVPRDSLPPGLLEHPSIFDAVREQLGLRLQPQKGPVPYLAVDHVEKPTGN